MLLQPLTLDELLGTARMRGYRTALKPAGATWDDLGSDAEAVEEALAAIVKDPEDLRLLVDSWTEWHGAEGGREAPEDPARPSDPEPPNAPGPGTEPALPAKGAGSKPELPDLPAGMTFSLDAPTVTLDQVEYRIPDQLSVAVDDAPITLATDLSAIEWVAVAKHTGVLYCYVPDALLGDPQAEHAPTAALSWRVPDQTDFAEVTDASTVASTLSYLSRSESLVQQRMLKGTAGLSAPFGSLAMSASRDERTARAKTTKRLRMTGHWLYPRATLHVDKCTALAPAFVAAIDAALAQPVADLRFAALRNVFAEFGTVYPREVVLGGCLYFSHEEEASGTVDESQVQSTVEAAVSAQYEGVTANAGMAFGTGEGRKVSAQQIAQSTRFLCIGGDTLRASNPKEWTPTVKAPRLWRVIERRNLSPLVDRLDKRRKDAVVALWDRARSVAWDELPPPAEQAFPDMDNRAFLLVNCGTNTPLSTDFENPGIGLGLTPAFGWLRMGDQGDRARQDGTCRWRLVYTGRTDDDLPLYYVVRAAGYGDWHRSLMETRPGVRDLQDVSADTMAVLGTVVTTRNSPAAGTNVFSTPVALSRRSQEQTLWWKLVLANPDRSPGEPAEYVVRNLSHQALACDSGFAGVAVAWSGDLPAEEAKAKFWRWRLVPVTNP